jgi:RNA polymerase subunit RPABC4/transcription elongation factor Spt4
MVQKACKKCRLIVEGDVCPNCQQAGDLSKSWMGYIFIMDTSSEVATTIGAKAPGRYALKIK